MSKFLELARAAAVESHGEAAVGQFTRSLQENQDGVLTFLFQSKLKGYPDWQIAVTLFIDGWDATVSEVVLVPGESSLVAPKWVPWSERLADYKALQAALEAEAAAAAALEAEEADDAEDDSEGMNLAEESESADASEPNVNNSGDGSEPSDSAVANVPEAPEAKDDADSAGGKGKGLFKWKNIRGGKKRK
ncbi:MAG: DUF3027 domain-containing protein [Micrococcales bacterium]